MANFSNSRSVQGLGTIASITVPTTDRYTIRGKIALPTLSEGAGKSAVVAVVNVNGSPVYTGQAGAMGFETSPFCSANDVITVVLSSAASPDQGNNVIKTTISISEGV